MGLELGSLGNHHGIHIHHLPTTIPHKSHHLLQQHQAVGPLPLGIIRREIFADVTQREGPEQGIHDRVHEHIGITVAIKAKPIRVLEPLATENQGSARHQAMHVVAVANAQLHSCLIQPKRILVDGNYCCCCCSCQRR